VSPREDTGNHCGDLMSKTSIKAHRSLTWTWCSEWKCVYSSIWV